jgi:hypothetical protein
MEFISKLYFYRSRPHFRSTIEICARVDGYFSDSLHLLFPNYPSCQPARILGKAFT